MCLGTTVTCRSCRREAIRFYPGGKCGEVKPFPAWHRIRGHTRRVRRCPDCIRIYENSFPDELEERNARFRRVYRRMKTFNRYCRGEHPNPLPDEEWTRYRDHPVIIDGERSFGQNERRMDEQSQPMLRRHSLDLGQHFSPPPNGMRTQVSFVQEAADYYREHEEPEVSFYEWTIRSYEEDETHNVGFQTENALDEDLNHYEWYLRNFGTELQLSDFRLRCAEIANSYFDFNSGKFNHISFQQWLLDYNLRQELRGQTQVTSTIEAMELYWHDVLKDECDELQEEFHRSRTRWFEESRREFYGHERDEYSPLIERLRSLRAQCGRITDWNNEHYNHLASVRENMGRICSILTTRIAMEREPTDEQWQRILEMGRETVRQMRETMRQEPTTRELTRISSLCSFRGLGSPRPLGSW